MRTGRSSVQPIRTTILCFRAPMAPLGRLTRSQRLSLHSYAMQNCPMCAFTTSGTPMRHSYYCRGVHPKIVSERLGHSKIGITLDTYSHVLPGMQEDAAAMIDSALQGAIRRQGKNNPFAIKGGRIRYANAPSVLFRLMPQPSRNKPKDFAYWDGSIAATFSIE